jgi:4'-phosphopantetheinyl transferase
MINLFLLDSKSRLTFNQERNFRDLLPKSYIDSISKITNNKLRYQKLISRILLIYALKKNDCFNSLGELKYSSKERPYFFDSNIDFNISYSNNYITLATSTLGRIGVDIEYIKPISYKKFQRQFTDEEWQFIITSCNPINTFYFLWTRKEALVKANGKGIILLPKTSVLDNISYVEGKSYYLHNIPTLTHNYILHVATQYSGGKINRYMNITVNELYKSVIEN